MSNHFAQGSVTSHGAALSAKAERLVLRDVLAQFEKNLILAALFAAGGNQRRAATALGVLPTTLQEKLKRFGLLSPGSSRAARAGERAPHPISSSPPHREASTTPLEKEL
jgi:DNA-binding NtrC family response regulator